MKSVKIPETKECKICGKTIVRKTTKGKGKRSPKEWSKIVACSNKCLGKWTNYFLNKK